VIVRVRGYLTFRPILGDQERPLPEGATLRTLLEALAAEGQEAFTRQVYDPESGLQPRVAVLVNGRPFSLAEGGLDQPLEDGDEVAAFPPLAGG
jgi:MoaD family protein